MSQVIQVGVGRHQRDKVCNSNLNIWGGLRGALQKDTICSDLCLRSITPEELRNFEELHRGDPKKVFYHFRYRFEKNDFLTGFSELWVDGGRKPAHWLEDQEGDQLYLLSQVAPQNRKDNLLVSIWTWFNIIPQPNRGEAVHWEKDCSSIHDPGVANHRWTYCACQNSCCPVW